MFTALLKAESALRDGMSYRLARTTFKINTNPKADKIFRSYARLKGKI